MKPWTLLTAAALAAVALAGCTSGDSSDPDNSAIAVEAPDDPATGAFRFHAHVDAASYSWDFGDGTPPVQGPEVEHTYGASAGNVTVTLTATDEEGVESEHTATVTLGDGTNRAPSFQLTAQTDWAATGQPVRFTADGSSDPDSDRLLYQWDCTFLGELQPAGGDGHGHDHGGGSVPSAPHEFSTSYAAPGDSLPTPDRVVDGDLCANARQDPHFHADATIEGAFSDAGLYRIHLDAKDPVGTPLSSHLIVFVSPSIPAANFAQNFTGEFTGGTNGTLQGSPLGDSGTFDEASHAFSLPLPAQRLWINVTHSSDVGQDEVAYLVSQGEATVIPARTDDFAGGNLAKGAYGITVRLQQGAAVEYEVTIEAALDVKPTHLYADPTAEDDDHDDH